MSPTLRFWTPAQRQRVAQAAFELLAHMGVRLTQPEARELLDGAGARIDGDRVYIPTPLVQKALASAPQGIAIYDRTGQPAMQLTGHNYYYGAHTDAPDVLDPFGYAQDKPFGYAPLAPPAPWHCSPGQVRTSEDKPSTHERRPCRAADVGRHAALIDALPQLHYTTASGMVADRPAQIADRVSLAQCLIHATKPVLAMPVTPQALVDCHEMAALAVGGADALRERPCMIVYAEPVSPLVHPDASLEKLMYCAEHGIPVVYTPYAAMGGTAPLSPAAIIAQLCAESLSGLMVHQLKAPGAPFIFGGMASVMDMKTTVFSYGAPEFQRGNTLMAEMAHHFELPNFGTAGTSDAQVFDGQALVEATSSCLMAALVGANLVHDVGLLGNATVVMPEMIVATDEIIAMVRHMLGDAPTDDTALALDLISTVGPGGEFVTHAHTLAHFRDVWYPDLFYRGGDKAWPETDQEAFETRVNARTRELMRTHAAALLPDETIQAIQAVIRRAEAAL